MTTEEIKNYNCLCAKFLGWNIDVLPKDLGDCEAWFSNGVYQCEVGLEMFDEDWNFIHEVIEKINNSITGLPMNGIPDSITPYLDARRPVIKGLLKNNKEETVKGINKFLIWYEKSISNS